jgi:hypothetical protein
MDLVPYQSRDEAIAWGAPRFGMQRVATSTEVSRFKRLFATRKILDTVPWFCDLVRQVLE